MCQNRTPPETEGVHQFTGSGDLLPPLPVVRGWTLLRKAQDYVAWHAQQGAFYEQWPPCFPCFVQERLCSDESTTYEYVTEGMLADMEAALASLGQKVRQ